VRAKTQILNNIELVINRDRGVVILIKRIISAKITVARILFLSAVMGAISIGSTVISVFVLKC
jgi:hypothetical protein